MPVMQKMERKMSNLVSRGNFKNCILKNVVLVIFKVLKVGFKYADHAAIVRKI